MPVLHPEPALRGRPFDGAERADVLAGATFEASGKLDADLPGGGVPGVEPGGAGLNARGEPAGQADIDLDAYVRFRRRPEEVAR